MEDGVGRAWVDAVVGNPPFMGGKAISSNLGDGYSEWLGSTWVTNRSADLSAYFFRRADWMLGAHGTMGLIATNSIAEGDTVAANLRVFFRKSSNQRMVQFDIAAFYTFREGRIAKIREIIDTFDMVQQVLERDAARF